MLAGRPQLLPVLLLLLLLPTTRCPDKSLLQVLSAHLLSVRWLLQLSWMTADGWPRGGPSGGVPLWALLLLLWSPLLHLLLLLQHLLPTWLGLARWQRLLLLSLRVS
jgi:hypothetical protein